MILDEGQLKLFYVSITFFITAIPYLCCPKMFCVLSAVMARHLQVQSVHQQEHFHICELKEGVSLLVCSLHRNRWGFKSEFASGYRGFWDSTHI